MIAAAVYRDLGNARKILKLNSDGPHVCSQKIPPAPSCKVRGGL